MLILRSPGELLVLVSYAGQEDTSSTDSTPQPRRIYAIVPLTYSVTSFAVSSTRKVVKVPYQSVSEHKLSGHVP